MTLKMPEFFTRFFANVKTEEPSKPVEADNGDSIEPVNTAVNNLEVTYIDSEGSWCDTELHNEIKIDLAGNVYFKINKVWRLQSDIVGFSLYR